MFYLATGQNEMGGWGGDAGWHSVLDPLRLGPA